MKKINFTMNLDKEQSVVTFCSKLVHNANNFSCDSTIAIKNVGKVDLKSILGVMSLYYANGREVEIELDGIDEEDCYTCLVLQ